MPKQSLEQRAAALERQMEELRASIANGSHAKDWRSTVGMFPYDETWKRIDEAGRKWREKQRRKARQT